MTTVERARRVWVRLQTAEMLVAGMRALLVARVLQVPRKTSTSSTPPGGVLDVRLCSKGSSGEASRVKLASRKWLARALEQGPAVHGWGEDPAPDAGEYCDTGSPAR